MVPAKQADLVTLWVPTPFGGALWGRGRLSPDSPRRTPAATPSQVHDAGAAGTAPRRSFPTNGRCRTTKPELRERFAKGLGPPPDQPAEALADAEELAFGGAGLLQDLQRENHDQIEYHALHRDTDGHLACNSADTYLDIGPNAINEAFGAIYEAE